MPNEKHGECAGQAEPIAIIGMGMRLPGKVNSSESFWHFIVNKKDGRCRVPEDRYNIDAFYSPDPKSGAVKSEYGYFLNDSNLRHLDTSFFSMNQGEVEKLDPQQRLLLEVVWECFENAGETQWNGKEIGCYVGVYGGDWLDMNSRDVQNFGAYRLTGIGDFVLGNRISYEYNLKGPRCVYMDDTAPASWLDGCLSSTLWLIYQQYDYKDRLFFCVSWPAYSMSSAFVWRVLRCIGLRHQFDHRSWHVDRNDRARCPFSNRIIEVVRCQS